MTKLCINCNLPVRGLEAEGDRPLCLTCLASLRPHTTYHEHTFNYATIEGMIRQSTDNPIKPKENERRKPIQHTNQSIKRRDRKD